MDRSRSGGYSGASRNLQRRSREAEAMIPLQAYKLVHIFGILLTFVALGGLALHAVNGGTKESNRGRRLVAASYGLGLLLILVGGFGMLARLGVASAGLPGWVWAKLVIWLAIGGLLALPYRKPESGRFLWWLGPLLGVVAGWLALYKPF
jgi:hypothetical protein